MFEIPCPRPNHPVKFENMKMELPGIEELPYANSTHFDKLIEVMEEKDIVRVFTSLLFEERVLLIMDNP